MTDQPTPTPQPAYQPPQPSATSQAIKGLLGSLFDLSFKSFVTPKVIKFVFILQLIGLAIFTLAIIVTAFAAGAGAGILVLILSPLIYLIGVLVARIQLELIIVFFRIYETLNNRPT
ncbi:MAG: DUF4282 domain-containing protein [Phycisphaeraceae bacterium]|nr:DUF4282 domain-containing protein [Phycisphaeraceae bacterium]